MTRRGNRKRKRTNDERQDEKQKEKIPDKEEEDYTDINVVTQKYANRFGNSPSWDSEESMIVAIQNARSEMRNERNKLNGIVKKHVEQRKEIQAQVRKLLDEIDHLKERRDELNKSVKEMKKERDDASKRMKEIRTKIFANKDKERNGEKVSEDEITELNELLKECEKSQEELHVFVTNIANEAQEAHEQNLASRKKVKELREAHSNEHRNVEKYRKMADKYHNDFLCFSIFITERERKKND